MSFIIRINYVVKTETRGSVFDFYFNGRILMLTLIDGTHGPSVLQQAIRNTFLIV